jgi:hypothetical protein
MYLLEGIQFTKQLHLDNLEGDTINSEIRVWFLGSNYNPQQVFLINSKGNQWTITNRNYYINFHEQTGFKIDSVSKRKESKRIISAQEFGLLNIEKIWQLPSQSEMKNGGNYGCLDGYALLIEMNTKERYKYLFYMCPDLHVSKDSTFQTIITFKDQVVKFFRGTGVSEE